MSQRQPTASAGASNSLSVKSRCHEPLTPPNHIPQPPLCLPSHPAPAFDISHSSPLCIHVIPTNPFVPGPLAPPLPMIPKSPATSFLPHSVTCLAWHLLGLTLLHHLKSSTGVHWKALPSPHPCSPPTGSSRALPLLHSPYLTCKLTESKPLIVLLGISHILFQSSTFIISSPLTPTYVSLLLDSSLSPHLAHISPKLNIWCPNQTHFQLVFS